MKRIFLLTLNCLLILSCITGFIGVGSKLIESFNQSGKSVTFKYSLVPLNIQNGYGKDSKGNIYLGDLEYSCILKYSSKGKFIYRIVMNTGGSGYFKFYIDDSDLLHVLIYVGEYELIIDDKEVISSNNVKDLNKIDKEYKNILKSNKFYISEYKYINGKLINRLANGNEIITTLEKKYWPPSLKQYFILIFVSIGGLFIINRKFWISISQNRG